MAKRKPLSKGKRSVETREPKPVKIAPVCIVFSFQYLVNIDSVGQSLADWAKDDGKLLLGLLQKMVHLSKQTRATAGSDSTLTVYDSFPDPDKTDFDCPPGLQAEKQWAVIRNIGGQKPRAAGFFRDNVFYLVYLDKEHKFWKSTR